MPSFTTTVDHIRDLPLYKTEKPFTVLVSVNQGIDPETVCTENLEFEARPVTVDDLRGQEGRFSIDTAGFQIVRHHFRNLTMENVQSIGAYKLETESVLERELGAEKVHCWEARLRRSGTALGLIHDIADPMSVEGPATAAHVDSTLSSGPQMVKNHLPTEFKAKYLRPGFRFRIVNTWRTLNPVLETSPLIVCDYRSVEKADLMPADRVVPVRAGEVYYLKHNPAQRWYWLSDMTPEEPLVMLMYDSGKGSQAKFCAHVSVDNPLCDPDAPPRFSIETRNIVISKA